MGATYLLAHLLNAAVIFGPLIGYIAQCTEICRTKNSYGFSTKVSLILILANISRVFFWLVIALINNRFGKKFDEVLLFAAVAMILCQVFSLLMKNSWFLCMKLCDTDLNIMVIKRLICLETYLISLKNKSNPCFAF